MTVSLRGLAWDHRRCWGPLDASVAPYQAAHPDVAIHWDRRSLYDFGEGRIEDVLRSYSLGASSFVRKPVDFIEFVEAIRNLGMYWLMLNEPPPQPGNRVAL